MDRRARLAVVAAIVVLAVAFGALAWQLATDDEAAPATTTTTTTSTTTTATVPLDGEIGAPGVGDPYYPNLGNGGFDVEHYDLSLTWLAEDGRLDGTATITALATQDLARFNLDLSGMEVRRVTVDGRRARFERVDRELQITPARVLASGEAFEVDVVYGGQPVPLGEGTDLFELGWHTDGREAFVASEPSGAQTWFPVNDHPTDKATYTFRITAPADQVVAANGELVATDDVGHGTLAWTYEQADPMASYLAQVAIGDYELVDDGTSSGATIRHAFHRRIAGDATVAAAGTKDQMALLVDLFGPYPFDAYGIVAVDEELGFALETQTLTLIGSDIAAQREDASSILLHELAHQWFGNAVSPSTWKDIWLNEGFAHFAEWLARERTGGPSTHDWARRVLAQSSADLARPPGDPGPEELFAPTVYQRGAMTLQAMREAVGDDDFFAILRQWYGERNTTASTADLLALAERVSGVQLDALFQTWLYEPVRPSF